MKKSIAWFAFVVAIALAAGCSQSNPPAAKAPAADGAKYLLAAEPAGAKTVKEVRGKAKDGDEIVIVGRIGGSAKPWIEGRAGFQFVDASFASCNEREGDSCPTPWDYCCETKEDLARGMATVKIVNDQGQTVDADARQLLGLKELDTVVVRGRAKRDDQGNLTVLAAAIHRRPAGPKPEVTTP
jgi:hypothetical protein